MATFSMFVRRGEAPGQRHGYGLSSSIYTTPGTKAFRFRERITAGMVSVNNSMSGSEADLPFGGN
jgi:aldehyde dehydrogenase (NAD+)